MKLLFSYLKHYKKLLALALILATVNQFFSLLDPQIFRLMVDNYATKAASIPGNEFIHGVLLLLFGAIGVAFVSRVAKNFQDYYVSVITESIGTELYTGSVSHAFNLPYAAFEDQRSGEVLEKLKKARADSQNLIRSFVNIIFLALVGIVFVIAYSFTVHWTIGLAYLLMIPTLGTITFVIGKKIKEAQTNIVRESAGLSGQTTETLRNVELVKSLGLENQEIKRLNAVSETILGLELKKVKLIRMLSFIQGTCVNALRSILLFLMLYLIYKGGISLGEFFSILFYSFAIFFPLGELGTVSAQYQEAKASMEQLEAVLKTKPEEKPKNAVHIDSIQSIEFKDLSFKYATSDSDAVENINIALKAGETIAFVGPSGSGKTTLIKLLVGLYIPSNGSLLINNKDAKTVDYETFRKKIGFVSQETQLFSGTIRENLLFVRPEASDEECLEVLRLAAANPIIERGGKGLESKIGEGGLKLSGGERQRLAIARALLRNPELIIFDEATSSLDSITERAITETIRDIEKIKTNLITVIVAHRLSTVMHAKIIHVLEKGKIIESGNHDELLKLGNLYAALFREQSGMRV